MSEIPSHKAHCYITKKLLGEDFAWLHSLMDAPAARLGYKHRSALHSPEEVLLISLLSRKPLKTYLAGVLHIACDKASTHIKRKLKQSSRR